MASPDTASKAQFRLTMIMNKNTQPMHNEDALNNGLFVGFLALVLLPTL